MPLAELLGDSLGSALLDVHTALPAIVKSYDATKQTCDATPAVKRAIDEEFETLPVIPNVPVAWPAGGGYLLHFPLTAGDTVMLVFSEVAWSKFRGTGVVSEPDDLRRHSLSYPIAFPFARAGAAGAAGARIVTPGDFVVGDATAQYVAIAALVTAALNTLKGAFDSWTPAPNDGGAALKTILTSALASWPQSLASTNLKAK